MVNEFCVLPIPMYNMQSALVHPTQYRQTLKDAVVAIHFTLKHWAINACNTNIADVVNMRVLVPPMDLVKLRRRKLAMTDPFESSGSVLKKMHTKTV